MQDALIFFIAEAVFGNHFGGDGGGFGKVHARPISDDATPRLGGR
jgi:hypothetical protein